MVERPLYRQVFDALREAIQRGDYDPLEKLPTEHQLADFYGVSRDTMRRALAELSREGWVDIVRPIGTFVRSRPAKLTRRYQPGIPRGGPFHTDSAGRRLENSEIRILRVEVVAADPQLAAWLEIAEGAEVLIRRRYWLIEKETMQLFDSHFPRDLVRGMALDSATTVPQGSYAALAEAGLRPARFTEEVSARMPTPEESSILRLGDSVPVLEVRRTTRSADGMVIEGLRIVGGADRTVLTYEDLTIDPDVDLK
ncbi:MAG: GntR family transcriptional regulator [Actinomycetota bacterium]